jgi:hypothetical protein
VPQSTQYQSGFSRWPAQDRVAAKTIPSGFDFCNGGGSQKKTG